MCGIEELIERARELSCSIRKTDSSEDIERFNAALKKELFEGNTPPTIDDAQKLSRYYWQIYINRFLTDDANNETWYDTFLERANGETNDKDTAKTCDPLLFLHPCDRELFLTEAKKAEKDKRQTKQRKLFTRTVAYSNGVMKCDYKDKRKSDDNSLYSNDGLLAFDDLADQEDFNGFVDFLQNKYEGWENAPDDERPLEPMVPHPLQGDFAKAKIFVLAKNPAYAPRIYREPLWTGEDNKNRELDYRKRERAYLGLHLAHFEESETPLDSFYPFVIQDYLASEYGYDSDFAYKMKEKNWYWQYYNNLKGTKKETVFKIIGNSVDEQVVNRLFAEVELFPYQTNSGNDIPSCFTSKASIDTLLPSQLITLYVVKSILLNCKNKECALVVRAPKDWETAIKATSKLSEACLASLESNGYRTKSRALYITSKNMKPLPEKADEFEKRIKDIVNPPVSH